MNDVVKKRFEKMANHRPAASGKVRFFNLVEVDELPEKASPRVAFALSSDADNVYFYNPLKRGFSHISKDLAVIAHGGKKA